MSRMTLFLPSSICSDVEDVNFSKQQKLGVLLKKTPRIFLEKGEMWVF